VSPGRRQAVRLVYAYKAYTLYTSHRQYG
jgi:hypothetical protein